jgi:hypothetical protein
MSTRASLVPFVAPLAMHHCAGEPCFVKQLGAESNPDRKRRRVMRAAYRDILSLTEKEPLWWDYNGTPRFEPFHPDLCPNIYADEVALLLIECAGCQKTFQVEVHSVEHRLLRLSSVMLGLDGALLPPYYGDPPRHDGCGGATMQSDTVGVLEFWYKSDDTRDWKRRPDLEIALRWVPKVEKGEE